MLFEWDETKAESNLRKHGVGFDEAQTAFLDEMALVFDDPDHDVDEHRFLLLGMSAHLRLLVVVHCARQDDKVIRIISARVATRRESDVYMGTG
ncbi:MAG TPA: BrnT family toxin [Myxococcota bacterium]|nr:BrnT family toxin [Myxococcota bacterium]HNZ03277.1 BrnT family toxin [Myxococcota bacterium]HOD07373.1 BrnT family toxin [Myxococcota bacterium]HPB50849.1 BrnT family toxin [Myxococcota bacterium]HQP95841.1 BrnT family toxin [Myxococcota bacterium]